MVCLEGGKIYAVKTGKNNERLDSNIDQAKLNQTYLNIQ